MRLNYWSIPKLQLLHLWSLGRDKEFRPILYCAYNYFSMVGFKLNHVSKRGPWLAICALLWFGTARFNSLAFGKWNFRYLIFQIISVVDGCGISCELALRWMSLNLSDDKSTLVRVMAWCRQAPSHYQSQCWPRYLSTYGVTRPQWDLIPYSSVSLHWQSLRLLLCQRREPNGFW